MLRATADELSPASVTRPSIVASSDPSIEPATQRVAAFFRARGNKPATLNEISDAAIEAHMKHAATLPTMHSTMHLYPINGAASRVGRNDTAWSDNKLCRRV